MGEPRETEVRSSRSQHRDGAAVYANSGEANRDTLVSIVVPSFNQGQYIRETLDSILSQDYRPIEVLVIDGGSTDETLDVLRTYGNASELRWWSEPDEGVADAVNKGLVWAEGKIVGIQSSDDCYLPGALGKVIEAFDQDPELTLAYGDVEYIDSDSNTIGRTKLEPFELSRYIGRFTYIPQPATFFRIQRVSALQRWRSEVSYVADADFWIRIAAQSKVRNLHTCLGQHRRHGAQRDRERAKICRDWEKCIGDLLASGRLNARERAWAEMGVHLARYKYCPKDLWWQRTRHLYRAAAANPRAALDPVFPIRELLPGRAPLWKLLSLVKRSLGLPVRRSGLKVHADDGKELDNTSS